VEGETEEDSLSGGAVDTQYFGAGLSGPLTPSLYYDLFGCLGTGSQLTWDGALYEARAILSYLVGAEVRFFAEEWLNTRLETRLLLAGGDADYAAATDGNTAGRALAFVPLSGTAFGFVFTPDLSNLALAQLNASIKPFSRSRSDALANVQTAVFATSFFRPTTGPVAESGLNGASTDLYLGTEVDAAVFLRPFSDFGASFSFGCFVPNNTAGTGAFLPEEREAEYLGRVEATFSF
jgi:hypothetical protein